MKAPFASVKEKFGDKAKLVAELENFTKDGDLWVSRTNADKGLAHVSNSKLLRLHQTFSAVKEKFGTRAKLIDAICELAKRTKDEGYKTRLIAYPVPRLWDMYRSAERRGKASSGANKARAAAIAKAAAAAKAAPKKVTAAKKVTAKAGAKKGSGKSSAKKKG